MLGVAFSRRTVYPLEIAPSLERLAVRSPRLRNSLFVNENNATLNRYHCNYYFHNFLNNNFLSKRKIHKVE